MKTGGIFGHKALGMAGGGVFGDRAPRRVNKAGSGMGCSCGTGAVVPDDFGVDLFKPSLPVTDEIMNEATLLEKEVAMANAAQGTALGLSGTQIALILGGVAIGVWMLTKGKRVKANKSSKRRMMASKRSMTYSKRLRIAKGVKRAHARKQAKRKPTTSYKKACSREAGRMSDQNLQGILRSVDSSSGMKAAARRELSARYDLRGDLRG
jgi:hypothetical protein